MSTRPANTWPAIFYSPHQDDEAIAMAGAIQEHVAVGRPVYLVLLTNGHPSRGMRETYRSEFPGLSEDELIRTLIEARNNEFCASAAQLGVPSDRLFLMGLDDSADTSSKRFVADIAAIILDFERRFPSASHKLVSGVLETHGNIANSTHAACWYAAHSLRDIISDFRFYQVYSYYKPMPFRISNFDSPTLTDHQMQGKRKALAEYKKWDPRAGRLAYGYRSVRELIDSAETDPHEYVDVLWKAGSAVSRG